MNIACRPLALVLIVTFKATLAWGLDAPIKLSQYAHTAWRLQDGVFNGHPQSVVQTADGYVWVGTATGLVRFDGVRFLPFTPPGDPSALFAGVYSLGATPDGSLWIGTLGLLRWKDGRLSSYPKRARINAILSDPDGGVWVTRSRIREGLGPLCHASAAPGPQLECFGTDTGIPFPYGETVFQDGSGALWLGGNAGLVSGRPGSFRAVTPSFVTSATQLLGIAAFAQGFDGSMLVGMMRSGPTGGLQEFQDGRWRTFRRRGLDGSHIAVHSLYRARDGSLWIGTFDEGLFVIRGRAVEHFGTAEGLSGDVVNAIYEDREGSIWVATSEGLDAFRIPRVITYSRREGLSSDDASAVLATRDGTIYVSNHDALDQIHDGVVSTLRTAQGLPAGRVTALLEDHAGRLWVGGEGTLSIRERGRFHRLPRGDGRPVGTLQKLVEDRDGDLWGVLAPRSPRLVHIHGSSVEDVTPGRPGDVISSVAADPEGGLWVGFGDGQVVSYRNGTARTMANIPNFLFLQLQGTRDGRLVAITGAQFVGVQRGRQQTLGLQNGLPCDRTYNFLLSRQGTLWLHTPCGLIEIDSSELQRWWTDPGARVAYQLFDSFDGVRSGFSSFSPSASEGPDGRLWFANGAVVQTVNPSGRSNAVIPPVHVESVTADRRDYPPQGPVRLPSRTRNLEIDYAALSFVTPQKVRFRYRLEGRDTDWQDPGNRRQAFYTDLPPGRYRFSVIASNNDGIWNTVGDTVELVIPPAFYQALWFKALLAAAAAGLIGLIYTMRMRTVTAEVTARFGERQLERERIARELHDTLLQDFQAIVLRIQALSNRLLASADQARNALEKELDRADIVIAEGRDRIRDIRADTRPFDELSEALDRYGNERAQTSPITFAMKVSGAPRPLDAIVRDEIYRIGREAIANAFKHSNGSIIEAEIVYSPRNLRISIRDDGRGVDSNVLQHGRPGHFGLPGMRERAWKIGATLDVSSRPGEGTALELRLSYRAARARRRPWMRRSWWRHVNDPEASR